MSGLLNHSPDQIVRQLLIDLSVATASSTWPVYASQQPDSPDESMAVFETAGQLDGRFMVDGEVQETYGVQIRVRASDTQTGRERANLIADTVDKQSHLTTVTVTDAEEYGTGNAVYIIYNMDRRSGPFMLKDSNSDLRYWTINYLATIQMVS